MRSFSSKERKNMGILQKGLKKDGYDRYLNLRILIYKTLKTGTVMATSPIAESLMTAICFILFDKLVLVNYFFPWYKTGFNSSSCTFSFACTLS
jgi:hypothetical protein